MNVGSDHDLRIEDRRVSLDFTTDTMTKKDKRSVQATSTKATRKSAQVRHSYGDELLDSSEIRREVARNGREDLPPSVDVEKWNGNNCQGHKLSEELDEINDTNLIRGLTTRNGCSPNIGDNEAGLIKSREDHEMGLDECTQNRGIVPLERVSPAPEIRDVHYMRGDKDITGMNHRQHISKLQHRSVVATPPVSPPLFRRRTRKVSMFEIQPRTPPEVMGIREICIEKGVVQTVQEIATTLPELMVSSKTFKGKDTSGNLDGSRRQIVADIASLRSHDFEKKHHRLLRQAKSNSGNSCNTSLDANGTSKTSSPKAHLASVQSCPITPFSSPKMRRRSIGVVTTAAWGSNAYRDLNIMEDVPHSPRTRRISSLMSPAGDLFTDLRKDSGKNNTTKNSSEELQRLSIPCKESIETQEELQNVQGNASRITGICAKNTEEQNTENENHTNSSKVDEDFRPRLRSRSLEDFRLMTRKRVLDSRESNKRKSAKEYRSLSHGSPGIRRKSFEAWLSDKEKQTIKKMNSLKLEKQREAEKEAAKRKQRKGKSYEEWLSEKTHEEMKNKPWVTSPDETKVDTTERQRTVQERYQKWLLEKENQALEKERQMLKEAERKTIEMRKKYEEKKKNGTNGRKYSTGLVEDKNGQLKSKLMY